jgi:hypothetical protein
MVKRLNRFFDGKPAEAETSKSSPGPPFGTDQPCNRGRKYVQSPFIRPHILQQLLSFGRARRLPHCKTTRFVHKLFSTIYSTHRYTLPVLAISYFLLSCPHPCKNALAGHNLE